MFGFLFMITQCFQGVLELTPLQFGIHSLPFAVSIAIGAPMATVIAQRIGTTAETPYLGPVVVSMMLMGLGLAMDQLKGVPPVTAMVSPVM